jgi:pyroglutamyl-peptidase
MRLEQGDGTSVTPRSAPCTGSGVRGCRVLITGFGAFPGVRFNPTAGLAAELATVRRPGLENVVRIAHVFETSYAAVERTLPAVLAEVHPDVVLLFGLATRTPYLRIETRALNRRSALFADVRGRHPTSVAITPRAPVAMRGNAPHQRLAVAARRAGVPAQLSHNAGGYLCNYVYWRALELTGGQPLVQFVHVPAVRCEPAGIAPPRPMTLDDLTRAGTKMLMVLITAARNSALARGRPTYDRQSVDFPSGADAQQRPCCPTAAQERWRET